MLGRSVVRSAGSRGEAEVLPSIMRLGGGQLLKIIRTITVSSSMVGQRKQMPQLVMKTRYVEPELVSTQL